MINLDPNDTIAAIGSPTGAGIRGLVRLSGPRAWEIALGGFVDETRTSRSRRAELRTGVREVTGLRSALPAAISLWPGPLTYTGQELAEIHTVGSPPLLNLLLADCLTRSARHAEPGEFTLRAFLSGRIDLTQAEAVLGVIDARTPAQLETALKQLAGGLAEPISRLRDRLLDVLAHLEAGLDFVEEADVDPPGRATLARELATAGNEARVLAEQLSRRDRPADLPRVVLIGPPNAGKSRLFNALLGQTRALVSPASGTTTDYLSAPCVCDGLRIELVDTAGTDVAAGPIPAQAQVRRQAQTEAAELILECWPSDSGARLERSALGRRLRVATKCDLAQSPADLLATSAATGAGLVALKAAIAANLRSVTGDDRHESTMSARCRESLTQASECLRSAAETLIAGGGDELVAFDLRQSLEELGKVVGAVVTDDILDRIFRKFCIGK